MLAAGGFVATILCPPLLARVRVSAKHAPAMGATALVFSVLLLLAFIETRIDFPAAAGLAFVIGFVGFTVVLFMDRLR